MAIAKVASTLSVSNSTSITTSAIDTTGADLLVVCVSFDAGFGSPAVSDSKGNTWSGLTAINPGSNSSSSQMFYCVPTSVGSGHTFTVSSSRFYGVIPIAFSGIKASSPFDVENVGSVVGTNTGVSSGSITPSENGELIISGAACSGIGWLTLTVDNSLTIDQENNGTAAGTGVALAYKVQSTAAAINATWDFGGSRNMAASAVIASFKEASAAATYIPPRFEQARQAIARGSRW